MTAHAKLIAEIEAAPEGSKELDWKIGTALFPGEPMDDGTATLRMDAAIEIGGRAFMCPPYTTVFDAAMALVKPGSYVRMTINREGIACVWVEMGDYEVVSHGPPALALAAAAMKAMEAS